MRPGVWNAGAGPEPGRGSGKEKGAGMKTTGATFPLKSILGGSGRGRFNAPRSGKGEGRGQGKNRRGGRLRGSV